MAKELPYFKFEPAEYLTKDISFCSFEAQGFFVSLCSYYWQRNCKMTKKQAVKRLKNETILDELISEGIVDLKGEDIIIKFLDKQLIELLEFKKKQSENGKKGGRPKKQKQSDEKPKENPPLSSGKPKENPNKSHKKRIEENRREKNKIEESDKRALDFLKTNFPSRFETDFMMKYGKNIENKQKFKDDFNDTIDQEDLEWTDKKLFARLGKYARNWIENQDKYKPKQEVSNPTSNIPIG